MTRAVCRHLRTKRMYLEPSPEQALADPQDQPFSPCHFWCNLTQTSVGKDDRPAHKHTCNPSRPCFEP